MSAYVYVLLCNLSAISCISTYAVASGRILRHTKRTTASTTTQQVLNSVAFIIVAHFAMVSEMLARGTVDVLSLKSNLSTFFDLDNLTSISMEALTASIQASCAVVVFLDDETHLSQWCTHELQMAKASSVGIIVVIDADRDKQVGPLRC